MTSSLTAPHVRTRELPDGRVAVQTMTGLHWTTVHVATSQGEANVEAATIRAHG